MDTDGSGDEPPKVDKAASKPGTSKGANVFEDDEELQVASDQEFSQKRLKIGKKEKIITKGKKTSHKMVEKNYAPNEAPDKSHKYYFRAHIGAGYHVSVAKWLKNNLNYVQIRKATTGANVPIQQYECLKQAIIDIEKNVPKHVLKNEVEASD